MTDIATKRNRTRKLVLTALFSALIAVGAFIRIPVPAVPFTMQMCFVCLAGLLLGGFYGGLSVLIYVLIGLIGVPIFANGGGIMYVVNPTFGYLIGMIIGGTLCGYIAHSRGVVTYRKMILGTLVMFLCVYTCGLTYFYLIQTLYLTNTVSAYTIFVSCMLVFLPGDIATCAAAILVAKRLIPILEKQGMMIASEFYIRKSKNKIDDDKSISCEDATTDNDYECTPTERKDIDGDSKE